jgi:hypothetical protein
MSLNLLYAVYEREISPRRIESYSARYAHHDEAGVFIATKYFARGTFVCEQRKHTYIQEFMNFGSGS